MEVENAAGTNAYCDRIIWRRLGVAVVPFESEIAVDLYSALRWRFRSDLARVSQGMPAYRSQHP